MPTGLSFLRDFQEIGQRFIFYPSLDAETRFRNYNFDTHNTTTLHPTSDLADDEALRLFALILTNDIAAERAEFYRDFFLGPWVARITLETIDAVECGAPLLVVMVTRPFDEIKIDLYTPAFFWR
jgi:hypothetical protein